MVWSGIEAKSILERVRKGYELVGVKNVGSLNGRSNLRGFKSSCTYPRVGKSEMKGEEDVVFKRSHGACVTKRGQCSVPSFLPSPVYCVSQLTCFSSQLNDAEYTPAELHRERSCKGGRWIGVQLIQISTSTKVKRNSRIALMNAWENMHVFPDEGFPDRTVRLELGPDRF